MEQIKELLNILKETPEMALWGITIYFIFILLKLASWVYALKFIFQFAISKYHDYNIKKIELEQFKESNKRDNLMLEVSKAKNGLKDIVRLSELFNRSKISNVEFDSLKTLLETIKSGNYIHQDDIKKAIEKLKK